LRLPGEATPDGVDVAPLPPDFGDANYIAAPDAVFSSPRNIFDNVRRRNMQQSRAVGCPTVVLHARALRAQTPEVCSLEIVKSNISVRSASIARETSHVGARTLRHCLLYTDECPPDPPCFSTRGSRVVFGKAIGDGALPHARARSKNAVPCYSP